MEYIKAMLIKICSEIRRGFRRFFHSDFQLKKNLSNFRNIYIFFEIAFEFLGIF